MSTLSLEQQSVIPAHQSIARESGTGFRWQLIDTWELIKRNLRHITRTPELLLDVTIQPIMFVLLFRYVFGGAINVAGGSYVNYLMAGIFVQTITFSMMATGILLANDLQKGLIDRFRSLPMHSSAILASRTLTDLLRAMLAIVIMLIVGVAVGFRPEGDVLNWLAALGLMLLFGFAMAWVGVLTGMLVRTPEAAQGAMFILVMPLTFASSAFVPTESMPTALREFAENQPLTLVINTVRAWLMGQPAGSDAWGAIAWSLGILIVFLPLGLFVYRKRTQD
jgi:ABC-2 type transport system permease protein